MELNKEILTTDWHSAKRTLHKGKLWRLLNEPKEGAEIIVLLDFDNQQIIVWDDIYDKLILQVNDDFTTERLNNIFIAHTGKGISFCVPSTIDQRVEYLEKQLTTIKKLFKDFPSRIQKLESMFTATANPPKKQ